MNLFPIGLVDSSNLGLMDGLSYSLFEPNELVNSNIVHTTLVTQFENMTRLTRQKALPFLTITYEYKGIYTKEFRQIEHFVDSIVEDALNSFVCVDWSKGITPSSISGGGWITGNTVTIDNTRLFSKIANQKANKIIVWDGIDGFKIGTITNTTTSNLTVDFSTSAYGGLSYTAAQSGVMIYPLYTVYLQQNALGNFKTSEFISGYDITQSEIGGFMYDGAINFISKYKV